jgi:hypothetical protein
VKRLSKIFRKSLSEFKTIRHLRLAEATQTGKLHIHVMDDKVLSLGIAYEGPIRGKENIAYPAATFATDVVVGRDITVKTLLHACPLKAYKFSGIIEKFEITVYGSQTDAGQFLTYHLVQFVSRGMRLDATQNLQDGGALLGHSCL